MIRDEIEAKLKQVRWVKTASAPSEVIDYQEREKHPYKRLILLPDDFKYITPEVLDELINSKVEFGSAEILDRAKNEYEKRQMTLAGTTVAESEIEKQVTEMRNRLKKVIDDFSVEKLGTLASLIIDFYEAEKAKPKLRDLEESGYTEAEKKWKKREEETSIAVGEGEIRVAVIEMATDKDADVTEQAFTALIEDKKVYRSAVIIDNTIVRTVEQEKDRKGETVVKFNTASYESAVGIRMLFDGTLRKEITIVRVTRAERKLSVSYIVTGVKRKPAKEPRRFTLKDTNGYELVDKETGEPIWEKERRGEGGETPFLVKRRRV